MHFLKLPVVALPRTPFICHRQQSFSSHLKSRYRLLVVVRVTVFVLAKVPISLIKHKCERKEASTPSLKTVHRTVFLTVVFKSRYRLRVWVVRVTVFALAKVPTSLIKHKCERKEASTPSLKTVHRTVFLTVVFKSRYRLRVWVVRVTVFALAKVPTSLIKHKCERKEASTPSLKTVHRTVFLTPSTTWSFSVVHKCTSSNSLL